MFTFISGEEVKFLSGDTYLAWYNAKSDDQKPYCSPLAWANENFLHDTAGYKALPNGIWETVFDNEERMSKVAEGRVGVYRWVDKKPLPQHIAIPDASTMTAEEIYKALDEMGE